ncbi:T9SS type A sorting domain-containing protein [candidate division KSB1 bacterium]|nr:T9SS type A sorting domain-containing protein [candidate division KSB1 bacterium]
MGRFYKDEQVHQLNKFSLVEPDHDSTVMQYDPVFSWEKASHKHFHFPWEVEYHLYLSKDEGFTSPLIVNGIYDSTYRVKELDKGTTYFWKVCAKNVAGDSLWSSETNAFFVHHNATSNTSDKKESPDRLTLHDNYPNPFNPTTIIGYELPAHGTVSLKIYDITGRLVTELINSTQQAGVHNITWNGCNQRSIPVSAGVYIYQLEFTNTNDRTYFLHNKMSLVK